MIQYETQRPQQTLVTVGRYISKAAPWNGDEVSLSVPDTQEGLAAIIEWLTDNRIRVVRSFRV